MASPASTQPAKKIARFGAMAITTSDGTASTEPAVITSRGPRRSISRPTGTPAIAETISPVENAAVTVVGVHPVSAVTAARATGSA
jgi:hypothetical protein